VHTYAYRAFYSIILTVVSAVGLAIVADNYTGNNYKMKEKNKLIMTLFFSLTCLIEIGSVLLNFIFYRKQRNLINLEDIFQADMKTTCCLIFGRVAFTISLAVFVISRVGDLEVDIK